MIHKMIHEMIHEMENEMTNGMTNGMKRRTERGRSGCLVRILAFCSLLSACGVGPDSEDVTAQQRRDAEVLKTRYSAVSGVYEGILENKDSGLKARAAKLALYYQEIADGVNSDGSTRLRPKLFGRFELVDFGEGYFVDLTGEYQAHGSLTLNSVSNQTANATVLSLEGFSLDGKVSLKFKRRGGVWGEFKGTRVSKEAHAPADGDQGDLRERMRRILSPLEGIYYGDIETYDGRKIPSVISLTVVDIAGPSGDIQVALMGHYQQRGSTDGIYHRSLTVSYDPMTREIALTAKSSGTGSIPGWDVMVFNGLIDREKMLVSVRNKDGYLGRLRAVKD